MYATHENGLTDAEAEQLSGVRHAWKRCSDLRKWGYIAPVVGQDGEIVTRQGPSGRAQQVCKITAEGWRMLETVGVNNG